MPTRSPNYSISIIQLDVPGRPLGQEFTGALSRNYRVVEQDGDYCLLAPADGCDPRGSRE